MRHAIGAAAIAVAACEDLGASPRLICHNANCVDGTTFEADDTIDALRASLAMRTSDGQVVIDGIELDAVWDRAQARCTFTHAPDPAAATLADAAAIVAQYVASAPPDAAAHTNELPIFFFKIELKVDVGGGATHTPDEVAAHVDCVTKAAQSVIAAGVTSQNVVVPIFDSDDPDLLVAIDPSVFPVPRTPPVLFETGWGATLPPGFTPYIYTLGWYEAPQELDWDHFARTADPNDDMSGFLIWARSPPAQDVYAILHHYPAFIAVNNALETRGVIDADNP